MFNLIFKSRFLHVLSCEDWLFLFIQKLKGGFKMQAKSQANKIAREVFIQAGIKYILDRHAEGKITWQKDLRNYVHNLISKKKNH